MHTTTGKQIVNSTRNMKNSRWMEVSHCKDTIFNNKQHRTCAVDCASQRTLIRLRSNTIPSGKLHGLAPALMRFPIVRHSSAIPITHRRYAQSGTTDYRVNFLLEKPTGRLFLLARLFTWTAHVGQGHTGFYLRTMISLIMRR